MNIEYSQDKAWSLVYDEDKHLVILNSPLGRLELNIESIDDHSQFTGNGWISRNLRNHILP